MIFKYDQLKAFFNSVQTKRKFVSLANWNNDSNCIILRHDIDLHVRPAYDMAVIERECGIDSTFLFLTTADGYNPLSKVNREMIRQIADWGFDVGLHFDPTLYDGADAASLKKHVDFESSILSDITQKEIKSISLHNPSVYNQYPIFDGYINAYSTVLFSDENYISDSCMLFREKNILTFFDKTIERPYQLLLHPLHYSHSGDDYNSIFQHFTETFLGYIEENFRPNRTYNQQVKVPLNQQILRKTS